MATTSKLTAPQVESAEGFEGRYDQLGDHVVGFEAYSADQDAAPLFVGLPDDACQSPHWGYVIAGRIGFRYTDGTEESIEAGQAYYARPGHTPVVFAGAEIVEFSPADKLAQTMEVVMRNAAAMSGTAS